MKTILILGAGLWQVAYIKKAKEMGLHVCVTDWGKNPLGKQYADEFKSISVRDKEASLQYAIECKIDAVFTNSDVGVQTAAYIAEKLHLPCYTQEQAQIATNKFVMRNAIKAIGLKTPRFELCNNVEELKTAYKLFTTKAIVKPIDNCGSRGVHIVDSLDSLDAVCQEAFDNSFSGKVLLEELMIGYESSVEVLVDNGIPYIMGWCKKIKTEYPYRVDIQLNYYPDQTQDENNEVSEMVSKLVNGLSFKDGIMHIEFIWTSDGVKIIEFALRGCGGNVITHLMPELRGFDIKKFLLSKALGVNIPIEFKKNEFGTLKFLFPSPGKVRNVTGTDEINSLDYVVDFHCELQNGYEIKTIRNGSDRPGHFIVIGGSSKQVSERIANVESLLKIEYYD